MCVGLTEMVFLMQGSHRQRQVVADPVAQLQGAALEGGRLQG